MNTPRVSLVKPAAELKKTIVKNMNTCRSNIVTVRRSTQVKLAKNFSRQSSANRVKKMTGFNVDPSFESLKI